jgi:hypothetical protein
MILRTFTVYKNSSFLLSFFDIVLPLCEFHFQLYPESSLAIKGTCYSNKTLSTIFLGRLVSGALVVLAMVYLERVFKENIVLDSHAAATAPSDDEIKLLQDRLRKNSCRLRNKVLD